MTYRTKLAALLVALVVIVPAMAADPEVPADNGDLRKEIAALREEIASLRQKHELDSKLSSTEMRLITERLDRIEKALQGLSPSASTRGATAYDPTLARTGTIRLDNRLGVMAMVTIDGVTYTIPPFSSRMVRNQPVGTITYEVTAEGYGVRAPVRTPLAANETLTLTVY